jgi:2'-5' RNA ligase
MFDRVPLRWLHLTMQGIGFTDEVDRSDVDRIVSAAQKRCAQLEPFTVTIGSARVGPETVQMPACPIEPLTRVRQAIRDAIGEVWGAENIPEPTDGWRAPVSLGYSNSAGPAEPVANALATHGEYTAKIIVSAVSLIDLDRDNKTYNWSDVSTIYLSSQVIDDLGRDSANAATQLDHERKSRSRPIKSASPVLSVSRRVSAGDTPTAPHSGRLFLTYHFDVR